MRYQDEVQYKPIRGTVKKITAKAVLIILPSRVEQWIPQSCIAVPDLAEICEGYIGEINVAQWLCDKEGL